MIILPDRKISRSKFLMPVPKKEWILPSDYTYRDQFNNPGITTTFHIKARLDDGHVVWRGIFDDREDFDAFLFAIFKKTLKYEKELWRMPTPEWHPDIGEHVVYEFATTTRYTATGAQTWTCPSDWNSSSNQIYIIGAGGNGGIAISTTANAHAAGGGGAGYGGKISYSATPGSTKSFTIAAAPAINTLTSSTTTTATGNFGSQSYFSTTGDIAGGGGTGGEGNTTSSGVCSGGIGGTGTSTLATNRASGADGRVTTYNGSATGGGGAAGISAANETTVTSAAGVAGSQGDLPTATNTSYAGGAGGSGASGGVFNGGAGNSTFANGGGGGGGMSASNANATGGNAGTYGAGGGGVAIRSVSAARTATAGQGAQGVMRITYNPIPSKGLPNLPMLGM